MGFFNKIFEKQETTEPKIKINEYFGFIDYGDGTIFDPTLNLMWQKDDDGIQRTYSESLDYCNKLTIGGYSDWHLPQKEELMHLAKIKFENLKQIFPNIQNERYWASTTIDEVKWAGNAQDKIVFTVDFDPASSNYGQEVTYFKTYSYFVKAVRNCQKW